MKIIEAGLPGYLLSIKLESNRFPFPPNKLHMTVSKEEKRMSMKLQITKFSHVDDNWEYRRFSDCIELIYRPGIDDNKSNCDAKI